ncbi:cathepsin Z precursor [Cavenderia fasciculata]|uniref:Cathepsin Z n=1 Tax=Cavenderia fasciculata TaxID=261658 RepID=F4QAL0_CACFS|nr:cathepsin Z precursor [Cavenderia fasciculata]EGG15729.1 cathepsin Z precursor [Cavenderia fasciculata]|eukprot:XP_004354471.1 cathepsin Z precursor [Cavenderia fasciculata]
MRIILYIALFITLAIALVSGNAHQPKILRPDTPERKHKTCYKKSSIEYADRIKSPLPRDYLDLDALPQSYDWRNVSGVNYLTMNRNQHIPQYCGGCWSFASTSAISDRINIVRGGPIFPQINASPQHLINCDGGGTCDGGDPRAAYEFMAEKGIVDETCQPYQAENGLACTPACKTCDPNGSCHTITNYTNIFVDEVGKIAPFAKDIMAEVYARGPVACSIDATSQLEAYTGGIFKEFVAAPIPNHIVSIVGWGVENDVSYWIVRNSWGSYFGESGFFRIVQGNFYDNLGIELDCVWATPKVSSIPSL